MRIRTILTVITAAALLVTGVTVTAHAADRAQSVPAPPAEYSGEEYFSGIFFGVGPVADHLPSAQAPTSEGPKLAAQLIPAIEAAHPGFFEDFKQGVTSGDHVQVRAAVDQGGEHLGEAFTSTGLISEQDDGLAGAVVFALVVAIAIAIVVAVISAVDPDERALAFEQYLDEIAVNLAIN